MPTIQFGRAKGTQSAREGEVPALSSASLQAVAKGHPNYPDARRIPSPEGLLVFLGREALSFGRYIRIAGDVIEDKE